MNTNNQTTALSGNLILSFNSADWQNGHWKLPTPPIICGGPVNGGSDSATLTLRVMGEAPNEIYLEGTASINLAAYEAIINEEIGGGGGNFTPGNPNPTPLVSGGNIESTWQKSDGTVSVSYKLNFELPMPWDGTSANCAGTWSISWKVTT